MLRPNSVPGSHNAPAATIVSNVANLLFIVFSRSRTRNRSHVEARSYEGAVILRASDEDARRTSAYSPRKSLPISATRRTLHREGLDTQLTRSAKPTTIA